MGTQALSIFFEGSFSTPFDGMSVFVSQRTHGYLEDDMQRPYVDHREGAVGRRVVSLLLQSILKSLDWESCSFVTSHSLGLCNSTLIFSLGLVRPYA